MLRFGSPDVMRYFGRRVNLSGAIPDHFGGAPKTDLKRRQEGERAKYQMNGNSAKFYDKAHSEIGSVLRLHLWAGDMELRGPSSRRISD